MKRTGFAQKARKPLRRTSSLNSMGQVLQRQKMRAKAKTPKSAPKSATGPMVEPAYFGGVKSLPCCCCGASGPSDGHHCKDRPPFVELGVYRFFPEYGMKSADFDAIPLCRRCHNMFHRNHGEFSRLYGPDYQYIPPTRATLSHMELDY